MLPKTKTTQNKNHTGVFPGREKLGCPLEATGQTLQTLVIQSFTEQVLSTYCLPGIMLGAGDSQVPRTHGLS